MSGENNFLAIVIGSDMMNLGLCFPVILLFILLRSDSEGVKKTFDPWLLIRDMTYYLIGLILLIIFIHVLD